MPTYKELLAKFNLLQEKASTAFSQRKWEEVDKLMSERDSLGKTIADSTLSKLPASDPQSPLNFGAWAGTGTPNEPEDVNYLRKSNIRESDSEVSDFFKSYINSPGFTRIQNNQRAWWESSHPYQKLVPFITLDTNSSAMSDYKYKIENVTPKSYILDGYANMSFTRPYQKTTFTCKPRLKDDKTCPFNFVHAHELAHIFGRPAQRYGTINQEVLDLNQNTKKDGHDELRSEKHADNWGMKYLLFKEGIYDVRDNQDITIEQVQQLREKYPELRPLQQMTDEEVVFQINNVASNNSKMNNIPRGTKRV